jgi:hypothetical protein
MMMKTIKMFLLAGIIALVGVKASAAQSMDFELKAGSSSIAGGASFIRPAGSGFMKFGISGVYSDDDSTSYQWGAVQLLVGSDTLSPGLRAEVGLKGVFGSAEERNFSGDIGAIAFTGRLGYLFPRRLMPLPLELFGGLSYAPGPLSFMDADSFSEITLGFGIRIIEQASLELSYHAYNIEMDDSPSDWDLDDSAIRFGLTMRF